MKLSVKLISLALALANAASAGLVIDVQEDASGVLFSIDGTLDTTGLVFVQNSSLATSSIVARGGWMGFSGLNELYYNAITGPTYFGRSTNAPADGMVDTSGAAGFAFEGISGSIWLPRGFTSGDRIAGSLSFAGETLDSLRLADDTLQWSLPNDTITMVIGSGIPVPEPSSLLMLGTLGSCGLLFLKRRRV